MVYTNADQFPSKRDELSLLIANDPLDVILLTETIPKAQKLPLTAARIALPGFTLYTNFDPDIPNLGSSGIRGISIHLAEHLLASEVTIPDTNFNEQLWVNVRLQSNEQILIGCLYRNPSADAHTSTSDLCAILRAVTEPNPTYLLIAGDFNYPELIWPACSSLEHLSTHARKFLNTTQDCYLHQHVSQPTRYRASEQPHTLDLVFTNEEEMINSVSYLPSLANSDHICLRMDIKCYATMAQTDTSKLNVNKGNYNKFREDLSSVDWYEELHSLNFIQSWDYFSDIFNSILKACVPTVKNYSSRRNLYTNHEARRQTKVKWQLWSNYTRTHD